MDRRSLWYGLPLLTLLLSTATGCGEAIFNAETDGDFLREGMRVGKSEIPEEPLLPTRPGTRWEMVLTDPNDRSLEEQQILRDVSLAGGVSGHALDMIQRGKVYRTEVYLVDPQGGISLVTAEGQEKIRMSPPLPIVRLPIEWEKIGQWQGQLTFRGATTSARAWYRVTAKEPITVPAGKYSEAYRVDTLIDTVIDKKRVLFPTTRWFVPGVGVVKMRFSLGKGVFTKELKKYHPARADR